MYKIVITDYFKKQLKPLVKKNRGLKEDFKEVLLNFNKIQAVSLGMGIFKIRISGNAKGKSGGYRLCIFILGIEEILTPVCIYAKNDKENITFKEIRKHLEKIKIELYKIF
ncbi:hypothetical protein A2229_01325 [Candidatus Peregrinibacteria bacterium RIFOXYA2_FULL_33_7]|nr:MAG: hypothetical protein A2229_01325 [Candidatus Peregrinibacteria bacterium RIFOXYA2_FULL_33_7]